MTRAGDIAGLVLAGGRSSRFGRDKAVELLAGRPLLAWAAGHMGRVARTVAVSAAPTGQGAALARSLGLPVLADDPGHPSGPLAGVCAGLLWAAEQGCGRLVTLACDTPRVDGAVLARLLQSPGAAMAVTEDGPQGLVAVWPVEAGADLARELAAGRHPAVHAALAALGAERVMFEDRTLFQNVNTPEELAAVAARFPELEQMHGVGHVEQKAARQRDAGAGQQQHHDHRQNPGPVAFIGHAKLSL